MEHEALRGQIQWAAQRMAEKADTFRFGGSILDYVPRLTADGVQVYLDARSLNGDASGWQTLSYKDIATFLDEHTAKIEATERAELARLQEKFVAPV